MALLVLGTACDETTAPEANDLSTDELISIALDTDDGADVAIFGELGFLGAAGASAAPALVPETRIHDFSRARPCSDGGQVEVVGTITHTGDRDTQTMEATIEANKFWFDCTRIRNDHTHVLNGSGSVDAYRKRVAGVPVGDQTTDQAGTVSISRDGGEARTCDYDLHSVRDPDTMTNHITGTICDREIDITKEWNWDRTG